MRRRKYPERGKPSALQLRVGEWMYLLEGALESANITRWVLDRDAPPLPSSLSAKERTRAYEVSVVDEFHRLGQRTFERHGLSAMWERPILTGRRGRPESIDIALFDAADKTETRLEFGVYSAAKLKDDSEKLARLSAITLDDFPRTEGFVLLWSETRSLSNTAKELANASGRLTDAAGRVSSASVTHLATSSIDLFSSELDKPRVAVVGAFCVVPQPTTRAVRK